MRRRSRQPRRPGRSRRTNPGPSSAGTADDQRAEPRRAAEADRLAGYRLIRRIASGERADVYLAAEVSRDAREHPAPRPETAGGRARLIALRVYDADAEGAVIAVEVEAMAQVQALPELHDLATLSDGRTCVVVERLAGPSLARILLERGLSCGEAVTVLAPIAVALGELERHGFVHTRLAASDVLFDDSGRPRLIGTGALRALDAADADPAARTGLLREMYTAYARLIDEVAEATKPTGSLDPVRSLAAELLEARPFRPRAAELERMLFALATPKPVTSLPGATVLGTAAHRLADDGQGPVWSRPEDPHETGAVGVVAPAAGTGRRWWPATFASATGMVDEVLSDGDSLPASATAHPSSGWAAALVLRGRALIAARRGALIVGGLAGAAALVLALTLVPPADESSGRSAQAAGVAPATGPPDAAAPAPPATEAPAPAATEAPDADPPPPGTSSMDDAAAVSATAELLRRRDTCFASLELACLDDVLQPGSGIDAADRAALVSAQAGDPVEGETRPGFAFDAAHVTGRMGDAWLVAVPSTDDQRQPASVLVMRTEAGWRLREIFG